MPSGISTSSTASENADLAQQRALQVVVAHHRLEPLGADEHAPLGRDDVLHRVVDDRHQRQDRREGDAQDHRQDQQPGLLVDRLHARSCDELLVLVEAGVRARRSQPHVLADRGRPRCRAQARADHRTSPLPCARDAASRCRCPAPASRVPARAPGCPASASVTYSGRTPSVNVAGRGERRGCGARRAHGRRRRRRRRRQRAGRKFMPGEPMKWPTKVCCGRSNSSDRRCRPAPRGRASSRPPARRRSAPRPGRA